MGKTKIEWTDQTDNPVRARNFKTLGVGHYCEKISPGCAHCYAEAWQPRFRNPIHFDPRHRADVHLFLDEALLREIPHRRKPRKIFPGDMTDLFGVWVPEEWIDKIMAAYACLDGRFAVQFLTKRPDRMLEYFSTPGRLEKIAAQSDSIGMHFRTDQWPVPHFWLGASPVNQKTTDDYRDSIAALASRGWLTWASYEPALGLVDWTGWQFLRWFISGNESGPKARPGHPDWHRAARDFCQEHHIAYFFKQWGKWYPTKAKPVRGKHTGGGIFFRPDGSYGCQGEWWDGKAAALDRAKTKEQGGRLLDGREWNEFPSADFTDRADGKTGARKSEKSM